MKPSRFNYVIPNGDMTLFFNGLTESFFEVPVARTEIYKEIIGSPTVYADTFKPFIEKMAREGFVIDDNIDEDSILESKYRKVRQEDLYHLMILPTYQCNLRCWYCCQEHQDLRMTEECIGQLKELLARKAEDESIKKIRLSWFGGEPLLGYDQIIDFTTYASQLAGEKGKDFFCDITTNGTLLNRKRIDALFDAGVSSFQITIDGDRETHDSVKVLTGRSAYDKTLENVNIIAESHECVVRFNYTHENLKPESIIRDLKSKISESHRANVTFMVYKVWQEQKEKINSEDVDRMIRLSSEAGFNPLLPVNGMCYADSKHFDCIFPNGRVEKCDNESPDATRGRLENGEIVWEGNTESHIPAFKNEKLPCRDCTYVPVCWGPCIARRAELLKGDKGATCYYEDKKTTMEQSILAMCANTKRLSNHKTSIA